MISGILWGRNWIKARRSKNCEAVSRVRLHETLSATVVLNAGTVEWSFKYQKHGKVKLRDIKASVKSEKVKGTGTKYWWGLQVSEVQAFASGGLSWGLSQVVYVWDGCGNTLWARRYNVKKLKRNFSGALHVMVVRTMVEATGTCIKSIHNKELWFVIFW